MKKTLALCLAAALLFSILCPCLADTALPVHVQGAIFAGQSSDSIPLTLRFDPAWLTEGNAADYHAGLAAFSAILCADSYFREKDLAKGTANRVLYDDADENDYSFTYLLEALGFSGTRHVESFREKDYACDTNDSVTMNMAYSGDYAGSDIFIIAIRGCFSAGEWNSIFDIGAQGDIYGTLTGSHPEWTDKQVCKGIGVAADRAMTFIREFITEHDDPDKPDCVLITGHSRGGAIAQVVGAQMEHDPAVNSRTYTFNTCPVTEDAGAENYLTIFNIYDSNDFFSNFLPFADTQLYRFGRSLPTDMASFETLLTDVAALKGRDDYIVLSKEQQAMFASLFSARFHDRESLYTQVRTVTSVWDSEKEADQQLSELLAIISPDTGLGLDRYCSVEKSETADGKFMVWVKYCDAAMLLSFGKTLAYGASAGTAAKTLFAFDETPCQIIDLLMANAAAINGGHLLINSYVLAQNAGK